MKTIPKSGTTPTDIEAARTLSQLLNQHRGSSTELSIGNETVQIPSGVTNLMLEVLNQVASGHHVNILPDNTMLSTAEAADLLNVSRPFVTRLLNEGRLPYQMVGTHKRIMLEDALRYKSAQREKSLEIMRELSAEAQDLDLGY
jgi:excisionase family DNA binding protein